MNASFANYGKLNPASEVNDSVIVELDFYGGVNGETSLLQIGGDTGAADFYSQAGATLELNFVGMSFAGQQYADENPSAQNFGFKTCQFATIDPNTFNIIPTMP